MQAARKAQALSYNGTSIMIFEDFSAAVVKKRQDFYSVKQQLKERGIVFTMLYHSAVLRIRYDGQERFFKQPKDVEAFLGGKEAISWSSTFPLTRESSLRPL